MIKHATTKEQSRRLIAAGVPLDTADMSWSMFGNLNFDYGPPVVGGYNPSSPAWSLMALMVLLPCEIVDESEGRYDAYYLTLKTIQRADESQEWQLMYNGCYGDIDIQRFESKDIFEVYVQMVEWLANGEYNRFLLWEKQ